ncbi:MAG: hypothetical protein AB7D57_15040 [Desulfovibrionaceae bacterium]
MANDPHIPSDPGAASGSGPGPDADSGSGAAGPSPAALLEQSIRRLTARVRGERRPEDELSPGRPGWWVLAVGEPYGQDDFPARDAARERLRGRVTACGVHLAEWVWVWDTANQAQVVLATLPTRIRAELVAERFRTRGLHVRVAAAV